MPWVEPAIFLSSTAVNCKLEGLERAPSRTHVDGRANRKTTVSLQPSTPRREPAQQVRRRWWIGGKPMRSPGPWLTSVFGLRLNIGESVTTSWIRCWPMASTFRTGPRRTLPSVPPAGSVCTGTEGRPPSRRVLGGPGFLSPRSQCKGSQGCADATLRLADSATSSDLPGACKLLRLRLAAEMLF